jgi:hypothetical protein
MRKIIIAIIAIFLGGMIYVCWRSNSLLMFTWFDALGMRSEVLTLRQYAKPYSDTLPRWVIFSLPQALWLLGGMVAFSWIWGKHDVLNKRLWSIAFCSVALGFEFGQLIGLVPGHFDVLDVASLILAIAFALLLDEFDNHSERSVSK